MEPMLLFTPARLAAVTARSAHSRPCHSSIVPARCATLSGHTQRRSFRFTASCRDIAHEQAPGQPKPKKIRFKIAAAASGKSSGVTPERNVYPFLPNVHDAIGLQELTPDPRQRRKSRPDSGEDAFFVSKVGIDRGDKNRGGHSEGHGLQGGERALAFGVADGVGGWANSGVDPSDFSHALCTYMAETAMDWKRPTEELSGRQLIQKGYEKSLNDKSIYAGGSTASLGIAWENGKLELTNLGDSGSMLFRNAAVQYYSPPQTHAFNTPYQLTIMPPLARSQSAIFGGKPFDDLPNAANVTTWDVQHGDVLLLATDGVFDNLFRSDLLKVVSSSMFTTGSWALDDKAGINVSSNLQDVTQPGGIDLEPFLSRRHKQSQNSAQDREDPFAVADPTLRPSLQSLIALSIVVQSKLAGMNMRRDGPFAKEAQRLRPAERWHGGKLDDTTAIVAVAVEEGRELEIR